MVYFRGVPDIEDHRYCGTNNGVLKWGIYAASPPLQPRLLQPFNLLPAKRYAMSSFQDI